jgi:hypothetical protein
LAAALWLLQPIGAGASEDAPAPDPAAILQELEKLEEKRATSLAADHRKRLALLREAESGASAAAKLFEEALKAVEFSGRRGQPFATWKNREGDFLRSPQFQKAVQLHAAYLAMMLRHNDPAEEITEEKRAADSWAYARALSTTLLDKDLSPTLLPASREVLFSPVQSGVLARWLLVQEAPAADDQWEPRPGDLDGILEKNVRRTWRRSKDPRLLATWDLQIQTEEQLSGLTKDPDETASFNSLARPRLIYRRALDLVALDQPNRATQEILPLIRRHPEHPDAPEWIATLRNLLNQRTPQITPTTPPPEKAPLSQRGPTRSANRPV